MIALIMVLCLPILQRLHLLADHSGRFAASTHVSAAQFAPVDGSEPAPQHRGHADHDCSVCLSFSQMGVERIRLDVLAVLLGESPVSFVAPDYVSPTVASVDRVVAIPRGPPIA